MKKIAVFLIVFSVCFSFVSSVGLFLSLFSFALFCLECMMCPMLILTYEITFTEPLEFLHNSETRINFFKNHGKNTKLGCSKC